MTDYVDWATPQAHAAAMKFGDQGTTTEIAALIATGNPAGSPGGVPLLDGATLLTNQTLSNITAGTSQNTGLLPLAGIGYKTRIDLQDHASAVATAFVKIQFDWQDSGTGIILLTESWVVVPGPNGTPHILKGRGPAGADQLRVTAFNDATSGDAVDMTIRIWESSTVFTRSDLRTDVLQSAGFQLPSVGMDQDILASTSPGALASGGTWTRVLPLYAGQVNLFGLTSSGAADGEFQVTGVGTKFGFTSDQFLFDQFTTAKGVLFQTLSLARFQCVVNATNHNAAAFSLSATVVIIEQEA